MLFLAARLSLLLLLLASLRLGAALDEKQRLYELRVADASGQEVPFSQYRGKASLLVHFTKTSNLSKITFAIVFG